MNILYHFAGNDVWDKHYRFRNGPVPFTRCHRASRHYMRDPRNVGEKRNVVALASEELKVQVRGKRKVSHLTDNYDDIIIARHDDRCWKQYRLTRYKTK